MNKNVGREAYKTNMSKANGQRFAGLGLPNLMKRHSQGTFRKTATWKRLARELADIEASLTRWEAEFPEAAKAMPWYEAREEFKRNGGATPTWWELAGAHDQVHMLMTRTFGMGRKPSGGAWLQERGLGVGKHSRKRSPTIRKSAGPSGGTDQ